MLEREVKISNLSIYLKKLKPRVKRKKEIIKIRVEINGIERRKPYRETKQNNNNNSSETRSQFFEKIERMDNLQSDLENKDDQLYVYLKKLNAALKKNNLPTKKNSRPRWFQW